MAPARNAGRAINRHRPLWFRNERPDPLKTAKNAVNSMNFEISIDRAAFWRHFDDYRNEVMPVKSNSAVEALGALAQEHRLELFRLLVRAGDPGMAAGAIADALGIPNSSLSFHLAQLRKAGLILQERQHRSLIYRANYAAMNALVGYLMENCCEGAECGGGSACETSVIERKSA